MRVIPLLDLTAPGVVMGRHAAWIPALELKVPFQWGGRITKYQHEEDSYEAGPSIEMEMAVLRTLAEMGMAPEIGGTVFVETLVSNHRGGWHADPCGAWAYEMADATKLPQGRFSFDAMHASPLLTGSAGAWGDIRKPGNVVNGYLVDVRRSGHDMIKWAGGWSPSEPHWYERPVHPDLAREIQQRCQFPQRSRNCAYQDFWIGDQLHFGERRVDDRAQALGLSPAPGESVVDLGCHVGGFLQWARRRAGATGNFLGIDADQECIKYGRRLARANGHNLCLRLLDAKNAAFLLSWLSERLPRGVDHLLCLSLEKHVGEGPLFELIDAIGARRTYLETNAVAEDSGTGPEPDGPMKLWPEVAARGGVHVGNSRDRNLRRLYRIVRA